MIEPVTTEPLLKINEVAAETGLTTRAIRYYEEIGLLEPAARSDGAYRLYDASDLERLQFIRSLRDDAGFSLAQIGQLLEDETARERNRERLRSTADPSERRALLVENRDRAAHQIEILETKAARLATMIDDARERARHLDRHIAELDSAPSAATKPAKAGTAKPAKPTKRGKPAKPGKPAKTARRGSGSAP